MAEMHKGYAMALFAISEEAGTSDEVSDGLRDLTAIFSQYPEYIDLLSSPAVSKNERAEILKEALGERFEENLTSFMMLLCEKGHINELDGCAAEYEALYTESKRTCTAYVSSAVLLTDGEKEKLKQRLEAVTDKSVFLKCNVDESLLGGVIVEVDGKVYDGSLKRRMSEIKKVMDR